MAVCLLVLMISSGAQADWRESLTPYGPPPQSLTGLLETWTDRHGGSWRFHPGALTTMDLIDAELTLSTQSTQFTGYALCAKSSRPTGKTRRALILIHKSKIENVIIGELAEETCSPKRRVR